MEFTAEEQKLLKKAAEGLLDGFVGDEKVTDGGSTVWFQIVKGVPTQFKEGPVRKYFDKTLGENIKVDGVKHVLEKWAKPEETLFFFKKFGWLMKDADVKAYSAKFKGKV